MVQAARLPLRARGAPALVAFLVLATALAGCAAPPPPPAPAPASEEPTEEARLVPTGEVANVTAQESEQSEFAKSLDEKFHTHNYWGDSLEKTLMDADVSSAPMGPDVGPGRFRWRSLNGWTPFELPEGSIVPPEAVRLEVTVTWPSTPTITGLRLAYSDALGEWDSLDRFPDGGGTVTIETDVDRNDIPHTTISKWGFGLQPTSDAFGGIFNGTVHVVIKAFRNDTLFVAPPHPDLWGSETRKVLFEGTERMVGTSVGFTFSMDEDAEDWWWIELEEGIIVPPHTGVLIVTLAWTNSPPTPDPHYSHPEFGYWPANFRAERPEPSVDRGDKQAVYTIPVNPKMVDSPYADETNWGFFIELESDSPVAQQLFGFGSVGSFDGEVTVSIVAEREVV